jgi:hypothetical protein
MASQWKGQMKKQTRRHKRSSNEVSQFIKESATLLTSAAAAERTVHISQSFAGTGCTSATIVCFVTCPNDLVLEMQYAIDNTVRELLAEHGSKPLMVQ